MVTTLEGLLQAQRELGGQWVALAFQAEPGACQQGPLRHLAALVFRVLKRRHRRVQAAAQQGWGFPEHPVKALIEQRRG